MYKRELDLLTAINLIKIFKTNNYQYRSDDEEYKKNIQQCYKNV